MSVSDLDRIDGIAMTKDGKGLALFLADHLDWEHEDIHLEALQEKINLYVSYFENKEYKNSRNPIFKQTDFEYAIIDIYFKYELSKNAKKFIEFSKKQLEELNIFIECIISD